MLTRPPPSFLRLVYKLSVASISSLVNLLPSRVTGINKINNFYSILSCVDGQAKDVAYQSGLQLSKGLITKGILFLGLAAAT